MPSKAASPTDQKIVSPQLADLLEGYREEIVASWVRLLYGMEASHYREQPVTELQATTRLCIAALITLFRTGSHKELLGFTHDLCQQRAAQGFDISEMLEGNLLLDEAVLPVIRRECQYDSYDDASYDDVALQMAAVLDAALRWLVIRFSKLYSLALNARLQEQVVLLEEQRLQLERRVREVSALVRSSALITSTLDLDRLLSLILEQLAEVVDYDRASIQLLFDGRLRIIAGRGFLRPDGVVGITFDPGQNALTRRLLDDKMPVVLEDVRKEPGFVADPDDPTRSWIGVPLIFRDEAIGALALDKKQPVFYDEEDGQTVLAFANQAAIAIENARLYDRSREQDILQERNRLARELHDSLSQSLFSMVLNAEAANLFFDSDPPKARAQIAVLYETANAALKDMRTIIFELRPANLEQEGLAAVLTKHAKLVSDRFGLKVRVEVKGQRRLPLHIEKALFRVAQEALNNVVKHANATEALVTLSTQDDWISMAIEDNGVGIEQDVYKPTTLGLTSMRERVEQLSGHFEIGPASSGSGTIVRAKVPCER
ncbi:MAG: GAF domain-containing sensor histidine kinase [Chloroflexi bacterium]|nr:GAF domain-containing sensor histidine kinase [Chloroflexota bacterium]